MPLSWSDFLFVIPIGLTILFGIAFLLFPYKVIQFQGKYAREQYKGYTDEQIDRVWQVPWERHALGSRSYFVRHAVESPHLFPRLVRYYRIQGVVALSLVLCAFVLMVLSQFS